MLLLLGLVLSNTLEVKNALAQLGSTANTVIQSSQFITYQNPSVGFKIDYPSNWTKEESPSANNVRFSSPGSPTALLGVDTGRAYNLPVDQIANVDVHLLNETYKNFTLISSNTTTLAGVPAQIILYQVSLPYGNRLETLNTILIRNDTQFVISYSSLAENFLTYLPTFQRMVNSFAFIPISTQVP